MRRKLFFIEVGAVIVFFVLLMAFLEYRYSGYETNIDKLFNHIKSRRNAQLAIVGNSHLGPIRNIDMFDLKQRDIINVSIGGQDIFHSYFLIQKLLEVASDMKYIILGIDYDMLGYSLNTTNQKFIARQYYKHTDTLEDMSLSNRLMASSNFFRTNRDISILFAPSKKKTSTAKTASQKEQQQESIEDVDLEGLEFVPVATPQTQSSEFCEKRAIELTSIKFSNDVVQNNINRIRQIIKLFHNSNAKLIIVVTPKQECFYEYSYKKNVEIGKNALYSLSEEFAKSLIFIDFTSNQAFADSLFIDPDHLNREGIELLVNLITEEVNKTISN